MLRLRIEPDCVGERVPITHVRVQWLFWKGPVGVGNAGFSLSEGGSGLRAVRF